MLHLKPLFFAMMLVRVMMFVIIVNINSDLTKYVKKRKNLLKAAVGYGHCGQVMKNRKVVIESLCSSLNNAQQHLLSFQNFCCQSNHENSDKTLGRLAVLYIYLQLLFHDS